MRSLLTLLTLSACLCLKAQTVTRLVVAGDVSDKVLEQLSQAITADSTTTVLFLGNNLDLGNVAKLQQQMNTITQSGARIVFVPGRYDWANGQPKGYQQRTKNEKLIASLSNSSITFLPDKGCPGPEKIKIGNDVELVVMDSQWWLHEHNKPDVQSDCPYRTEMQIEDELADIVSDGKNKLLIFASYHPLKSTGLRSGYFGVKQHLFPLTDINGLHHFYLPLPVLGSFYPLARGIVVSRQDMMHTSYQKMIKSVDNILNEHPYLIRVAAHDKMLGLYEEEGRHYIISGSGNKTARAQHTLYSPYVADKKGFAVIEVSKDKDVTTTFYEVDKDQLRTGYNKKLFNFAALPPIAPDTAKLPYITADSVTAAVNIGYNEVPGFKRWLDGNNYRTEWATPVKLKVFRINEEMGGFSKEGQGGGKQTTTLRLKDNSGKQWSLRSIVKDPEKVIPENFRNTLAQDMVTDILSASHPFAAPVVTSLAQKLHIAAPDIRFYFVPNDTALGYYRPAFANTVVMMEERDASLYGEKTTSTWDVFNDRLDKKKVAVDQTSFLKARLLDILIADFDRHYEQFKWGKREADGKKEYYAIPKDRDQAFFASDGVVMKLFAYSRMPFLKGLRNDIPSINWYGFVARDIDNLFLNQLTQKDWEQTLSQFQASLADEDIENAVQQLPPEIYAVSGKEIAGKLKSRRDVLAHEGLTYYSFLAKNVNVPGSNSAEVFRVSKGEEGTTLTITKKGEEANETYRRTFKEHETEEVRLYGLNGDDEFKIDEDVHTSIRFRVIGGKGNDSFDMKGNARNVIYDAAGEHNGIISDNHTTNMISGRKDVNDYTFRENTYNSIKVPTINIGYNIEDQFLAGLGFTVTKQGFRKLPYASQHRFISLFSFINKAYQLRYDGEIIDFYRHFDFTGNATLINPHVNNFFGFGNETVKDTFRKMTYYRVRFSSVSADVAIRKRFLGNKLGISVGPSFYYYWNNHQRNENRILSTPSDVGLDSNDVYSHKMYLGAKLTLAFNSIDNELLPTRGVGWTTSFTHLSSMNEASFPLNKLQSDLSVYAPLSSNKRFIFVLNTGGGHIFTDKVEYFQALTLGANNYLRGFRKNRFTGSSMFYGSTELRMKLFDLRTKLLTGNFGLVGFNDIGRVWMKGEHSDKWHDAYGGGFYFTPYNLVLLSVLVAQSEEETMFNVSIGTRLNINF